ncbi:hypothetical protein FH972_022846 [Carpinus fangiana]|uniref:tRNA-splicing endonuclease subunit Sen15 domain-containing protein n=1 Tax=Carpinus fangiana TaxID=176857 RepID=A0A5N6KTF4_9ROSI|nr:hypothetical protein FH972_022846 [Carpinus fangiana]
MDSSARLPEASAVDKLIAGNVTSTDWSAEHHLHALALQVKQNLERQHDWTSVQVYTHSPLQENQELPRPILSGIPPRRVYIHPDEQIELIKAGIKDEDLPPQAEWVLPSHLREKWSLHRFGKVFDSISAIPPHQPDQAADENTKWRQTKRLLLATIEDDSTVVYYVVHDGIMSEAVRCFGSEQQGPEGSLDPFPAVCSCRAHWRHDAAAGFRRCGVSGDTKHVTGSPHTNLQCEARGQARPFQLMIASPRRPQEKNLRVNEDLPPPTVRVSQGRKRRRGRDVTSERYAGLGAKYELPSRPLAQKYPAKMQLRCFARRRHFAPSHRPGDLPHERAGQVGASCDASCAQAVDSKSGMSTVGQRALQNPPIPLLLYQRGPLATLAAITQWLRRSLPLHTTAFEPSQTPLLPLLPCTCPRRGVLSRRKPTNAEKLEALRHSSRRTFRNIIAPSRPHRRPGPTRLRLLHISAAIPETLGNCTRLAYPPQLPQLNIPHVAQTVPCPQSLASPWSPFSRKDSRRPSTQSSWNSHRRPSRPWIDPYRGAPSGGDADQSQDTTVSPRISFDTPVWERPVRPLDIPQRRSQSPPRSLSISSVQDSLPRRAVTVAAGSYASPTSPHSRAMDPHGRQDSVPYSTFQDIEDMSMFAAAMTGLDDGWSCGPPALNVPEPLSPTVLPSPRDQQWPPSSSQTPQPSQIQSLSQHQSRQPSPPLTPPRAPSPAFSFEDQPTSHIEEYPDSNRSFAAALTGMASADVRDDDDDELPDYAQSQLEAASATRRQALLRAAELERRWTASRVPRWTIQTALTTLAMCPFVRNIHPKHHVDHDPPSVGQSDEEHRRYHWIKASLASSKSISKQVYPADNSLKEEEQHGLPTPPDSRRSSLLLSSSPTAAQDEGQGQVIGSGRHQYATLVLDAGPAAAFMQRWNSLFKLYAITHLRSPMFFHLDPSDRDALLSFAHSTPSSTGRQTRYESECREITNVVGREVSKHARKKRRQRGTACPRPPSEDINIRDRADYYTPSTALFADHCRAIVARYALAEPVLIRPSSPVVDITYAPADTLLPPDARDAATLAPGRDALFRITTADGTTLFARAVVCAAGPPALRPFPTHSPRFPPAAACHSLHITGAFPPTAVRAAIARGAPTSIAIVGAGLTAVQLADLALRRGVSRVHLLVRRAAGLRVRPFDVELAWLSKFRNREKAAFWSADEDAERVQMVREARGGGSVPGPWARRVREWEAKGRVVVWTGARAVGVVAAPRGGGVEAGDGEGRRGRGESGGLEGGRWTVVTEPPTPQLPSVDYVYFATGPAGVADMYECPPSDAAPQVPPFLHTMQKDYPIEWPGGLPALTDDLSWRGPQSSASGGVDSEGIPLFITGALAALRLGPGAANLEGARLGAERIAWAVESLPCLAHTRTAEAKGSKETKEQDHLDEYVSGVGGRYGSLADEDS